MMIYELTDLTKVYGTRTVLEIPRLSIEENRIYALLGPNGAGKTTLLNILGFLDTPTAGTLRYRSEPVAFTETSLQSPGDIVLPSAFPDLKRACRMDSLVTGVKSDHNLAKRDNVIFAFVFRTQSNGHFNVPLSA